MKKLAIAIFSFFFLPASFAQSSGNVIVSDGSRFSTPEAAARYEIRHLKSNQVTKYEFVDCPKLQKGNATVAGIIAKGTYHCRMLVTIESGGNKTVTHSPIYVYWLGDDGESENKCADKKGQKYGDGTAGSTVTGKENVDRLLSWPSGKPMHLCADGCQVSGFFP